MRPPEDSHPFNETAVAAAPASPSPPTSPPGGGYAPTELSGPEGAGETAVADSRHDLDESGEEPAPQSGEVVDTLLGSLLLERYQITAKIGQGGMGAVYEAKHTLINKRVAVKVLLDKFAQKDQIVARLKQEAQLASTIGHENIIDITDFGTTSDGRTFVVMEYLEGESLAELLAREGPLPEQRVIRIGHQIASALFAAHEKGILHRDVKPENIFLLQRKGTDFVKVVDFGISKSLRPDEDGESQRLTKTGMVIGTPLYMSPEQARGDDDLDHRIDIYAVGVILYELVTGQVPFHGNNYLSIISQVLNDEPPAPRDLREDLSPEFEAVILRALEKDPVDRYQTSAELANDLHALIEEPGRTTANKRITAPLRRRRGKKGRSGLRALAWVAGIAVIVSAVVITVAVIMPGNESAKPALAIPAPVDAAPAQPVDAAAPVRQTAQIQIITYPRGAEIFHKNRLIGRSNFMWDPPLGDDTWALVAKHAGYEDTEFEVTPSDDDGELVEVDLKKLAAPGPESAKPSGRRTKPRRVVPTGPVDKPPKNPPDPLPPDGLKGFPE